MSWSLCQYRADGGTAVGILSDGVVHALADEWPRTTLEVFDDWSRWQQQLQDVDVASLTVVADAQLLAPITYPRKLLCAGANYYDHAEEMGTARPDPTETPFFFLKPPTTTVIASGTDIPIVDIPTAGIDWEIELAVVISTRCRAITAAEAPDYIAGYAVANDVSARGRFPRPNAVFPPFSFDWLQHKGFDSSNPFGPGIVPAWFVPDPHNLSLNLSVNGVQKQRSSTSNMVVGVFDLVAAASRMVTLEPGDVILTGTPAGVAMPTQSFLSEGDVMVAEIEGLGRLENRIVSAR